MSSDSSRVSRTRSMHGLKPDCFVLIGLGILILIDSHTLENQSYSHVVQECRANGDN